MGQQDSRYKKYVFSVEKNLQLFESINEWADIISFLTKLCKTLQLYTGYSSVPRKVLVSKRLSQCLNPALPSGVHQKALETYSIIFDKLGEEKIVKDFYIYSYGILPFFRNSSLAVRGAFLAIFKKYLMVVCFKLSSSLNCLVLSILPGLEEENNEFFDQVMDIINEIRDNVGEERFFGCLWRGLMYLPSYRLSIVNYLLKKPFSNDYFGNMDNSTKEEMVLSMGKALFDDTSLVTRGLLEFIIKYLPFSRLVIDVSDKVIILDFLGSILKIFLRKDSSLNRRCLLWIGEGHENKGNIIDYLSESIRNMLTLKTYNGELLEEPFTIVVSLLNRSEIGVSLSRMTVIDFILATEGYCRSFPDRKQEILAISNTFFTEVDIKIIWNSIYGYWIDNNISEKMKVEVSRFVITNLKVFDDERSCHHVPFFFTRIICNVSEDMKMNRSEFVNDKLKLCLSITDRISDSYFSEQSDDIHDILSLEELVVLLDNMYIDECCQNHNSSYDEIKNNDVNIPVIESSSSSSDDECGKSTDSSKKSIYNFRKLISKESLKSCSKSPNNRSIMNTIMFSLCNIFGRINDTGEYDDYDVVCLINIFMWSSSVYVALFDSEVNSTYFVDTTKALIDIFIKSNDMDTMIFCMRGVIFIKDIKCKYDEESVDGFIEEKTMQIYEKIWKKLCEDKNRFGTILVNMLWTFSSKFIPEKMNDFFSRLLIKNDVSEEYKNFSEFLRLSHDLEMFDTVYVRNGIFSMISTLESDLLELRNVGCVWLSGSLGYFNIILDPIISGMRDSMISYETREHSMFARDIEIRYYNQPFNVSSILYSLKKLETIIKNGSSSLINGLKSRKFKFNEDKGMKYRFAGEECKSTEGLTYSVILFRTLFNFIFFEVSEEKKYCPSFDIKLVETIQFISLRIIKVLLFDNPFMLEQEFGMFKKKLLDKLYFSVFYDRREIQPALLEFVVDIVKGDTNVYIEEFHGLEFDFNGTNGFSTDKLIPPQHLVFKSIEYNQKDRTLCDKWVCFVTAVLRHLDIDGKSFIAPILVLLIRRVSTLILSDILKTLEEIVFIFTILRPLLSFFVESTLNTFTEDQVQVSSKSWSSVINNVFWTDQQGQGWNQPKAKNKMENYLYRIIFELVSVFYTILKQEGDFRDNSRRCEHRGFNKSFDSSSVQSSQSIKTFMDADYQNTFKNGCSLSPFCLLEANMIGISNLLYEKCRNVFFLCIFNVFSASYYDDLSLDLSTYHELVWLIYRLNHNPSYIVRSIMEFCKESLTSKIITSIEIKEFEVMNFRDIKEQIGYPQVKLGETGILLFLEMYIKNHTDENHLDIYNIILSYQKEVNNIGIQKKKCFVFGLIRIMKVLLERSIYDRKFFKEVSENISKTVESFIVLCVKPNVNNYNVLYFDFVNKFQDIVGNKDPNFLNLFMSYLSLTLLKDMNEFGVEDSFINSIVNSITHNFISLQLKSVLVSNKLIESSAITVIDVLYFISRSVSGTGIKCWKKDYFDFFMDNRFFKTKLDNSYKESLLNMVLKEEQERVQELIVKVPSTGIFISKENELLGRLFNIKRISFIIFSGSMNQYVSFLPLIQEKVVEIFKIVSTRDQLVISYILPSLYLMLRILLLRFSDKNYLHNLLPILFTEMFTFFKNLKAIDEDTLENILEISKFIECLNLLAFEEIQLYQVGFFHEDDDASGEQSGLVDLLHKKIEKEEGKSPLIRKIINNCRNKPEFCSINIKSEIERCCRDDLYRNRQ